MLNTRAFWVLLILMSLMMCGPASAAEEGDAPQAGSSVKGLQQRIDFGNAYILGQSIKSGAVYLLHRKQSELKGMLEVRQNYREEIMEDNGLEKTAIVSGQENKQPKSAKK